MTPWSPTGAFRTLRAPDRADYAAHLLRLSPEDRRSRFHAAASDAQIVAHAARAIDGPGHVIGWFWEGALRGAAELALSRDGAEAEAALEVESPFRGRGVGAALVELCALKAQNRGARRLVIHTTRSNVAMLRAARRNGASFEFDLGDAEGIIPREPPTLATHLREAAAEQAGLLNWARDAWLRRVRGGGA